MEELNRKKINFSEIIQGMKVIALDQDAFSRFSVDKRRIKNALEMKNKEDLRNMSQYFYHNSGEYRRLVDYFGSILTNDYVIIPAVEREMLQEKRFQNQFKKVMEYSEKANIQATCGQIAQIVIRDGAFYGYERDLDGVITLQQLPSSFCRSRFKVRGVYTIEFDYSFFSQYTGDELVEILSAFPEEMQEGFRKYLRNSIDERWQILDPIYARCHMLEDEIPMLAPVFLDLIELEDYKKIDKIKSGLDIYKIIVQKIPLNSDNELTFHLDELKQFHQNLRKMVSNSNVDVATTPCEVDVIDLQDRAQSVKDDVKKALDIVYSTAGTPTLLFNSGSKSGSVGLRESIRVDENLMYPLLMQYEIWYRNRFEEIAKSVPIKIIFPPISHFNRKEMMELYDKGATQGFPTKILAMAAIGLKQTDFDFLLNYENEMLKLHERMIPTSSSYQTPGEGGRPEQEEPLSDEGEQTRDKRKNDDRASGGE